MVSKNNKQEQLRRSATKKTRFSLKKLSVGVASVAVGATLLIGNVAHAQEEVVTSEGSKETEDQTTEENKPESVEGDNADNGVLNDTPVSESSSIDTPAENQEAPEGAVNVSNADEEAFNKKRLELSALFQKRNAVYNVLEEVNGKKVTNRLQQAELTELANKIEKVYAELNELAKTSEQKGIVEGLKNALINQYLTVPPLKESEQSSEFELAKRQAKAFITGLSSDLSDEQRKKYYDAIDKVDVNDPDYVQRMEEIYQVAAAEKLTRSVEKGNTQHKKLAEDALKNASAGTKGGSLIDGKDKLVQELEKQLEEATKQKETDKQKPNEGGKNSIPNPSKTPG